MPIVSESFPARSVARKFLQSKEDDPGCQILGIRDERLSTMAHVWVISTDPKQMKADLAKLEELRSRELGYLIVDMERVRTIIDLFKEDEAVIEDQISRHLSWHKLAFYRLIQRSMATIRSRLGLAAAPPAGSPCNFPLKDA